MIIAEITNWPEAAVVIAGFACIAFCAWLIYKN